MKLAKAIAAVEGYMLRHAPSGTTPKIYAYNETEGKTKHRKWAGVMVAEVDFVDSSGGCSFMQVAVPWGIAVCGQVERCLLAIMENWSEEERSEEFERLSWCLKGER